MCLSASLLTVQKAPGEKGTGRQEVTLGLFPRPGLELRGFPGYPVCSSGSSVPGLKVRAEDAVAWRPGPGAACGPKRARLLFCKSSFLGTQPHSLIHLFTCPLELPSRHRGRVGGLQPKPQGPQSLTYLLFVAPGLEELPWLGR